MDAENREETMVAGLLPLASASQQPYVSELLSFTLDRLHKEPELLRVDAERIRRQMQEVAVGNYRTFIVAADALLSIREQVTAVDKHLESLIHSKRRNRLEHKRLNDLVYVCYNQILHHRYQKRDSIDPISLKDIDDSNEWLTGQMESLDLDEGGDGTGAPDLVFPGEDLDWAMVSEAAGVDEPQARTRAKGKTPVSTSHVYQRRGRARQAQVDEEEDVDVDVDEDEEEEEEEFVCDDDDSGDYPEEDATYDNDSP